MKKHHFIYFVLQIFLLQPTNVNMCDLSWGPCFLKGKTQGEVAIVPFFWWSSNAAVQSSGSDISFYEANVTICHQLNLYHYRPMNIHICLLFARPIYHIVPIQSVCHSLLWLLGTMSSCLHQPNMLYSFDCCRWKGKCKFCLAHLIFCIFPSEILASAFPRA